MSDEPEVIDLGAAYRGYHSMPVEEQLKQPIRPIDVRMPNGEVVILWHDTTTGPIPSDTELQQIVFKSRRVAAEEAAEEARLAAWDADLTRREQEQKAAFAQVKSDLLKSGFKWPDNEH